MINLTTGHKFETGLTGTSFSTLSFRLLRQGKKTPSRKFVNVYTSMDETALPLMSFETEDGEITQQKEVLTSFVRDKTLLVVAFDKDLIEDATATYLVINKVTDKLVDIYDPLKARPDYTGNGTFYGEPPDWLTTIDGVPSSTTVRILYRPESGAPFDGDIVTEITSEANGSWIVSGLNPNLKYDIVARSEGCNDAIQSNVSPRVI